MPIPDWDNLRLFIAVARAGRMAGAARLLGLDHSTVARRLTALENSMGTQLLDRLPTGIRLTSAGSQLLIHAERMEAEAHAAERTLSGVDHSVEGVVRLATPEAFGTYLVAPAIAKLQALHPALQLELLPGSRSVSLTQREADIAVTLSAPPRGRLYIRRLTDYRLGLYASRKYLENHSPIDSVSDLSSHPFVWYINELVDIPELQYLDQAVAGARTQFRSSSLSAQHLAVASSAGLGLFHAFAASTDPRLVPVLAKDVSVTRSYWLAVHADQRTLPRIRAVTDFLFSIIAENRENLA